MNNKKMKKVVSVSLASALTMANFVPGFAAVEKYVLEAADSTVYEYEYAELSQSYTSSLIGLGDATLYNHYKGIIEDGGSYKAILDDVSGYVDYQDVVSAYTSSLITGEDFDINEYTETEAAAEEMPSTVKAVTVTDGAIEETDKDLGGNVDELAVESVSAINAKTLGITFTKEPTAEEKAAMTFEAKNGDSTVLVKADSWDGATAKVIRTSGVAYDAGTYTLTVKGLAEGANASGTVTVETQVASVLELTTTVINDETAKSKLAITFQDQYGEDLTLASADFTVTAYNKTQSTSVTSKVKFDSTDKYFYVDTDDSATDFEADDIVALTMIHNATGLKFTNDLTVGQSAAVDSVTFGEMQLPAGKTILSSDLTNVKVPYTAQDQYGNDITLSLTNVSLISSDPAVLATSDVTFTTDSNGDKFINVAKFLKEGDATLTVLGLTTGNTATVTFDVQQAPGSVASVSVEESNKTIAAGSTAYVGLTVTDKYGNAVEAKDYIGTINVTSSNPTVVVNGTPAKLKVNETTGDNYGKLLIAVESTATKDATTVITLTDTATGTQYATVNVKAGEAATAAAIDISADSKHKTSLLKGATSDIVFAAKDQYGNDWTATGAYKVDFVVKDASDVITLSPASDNDESAATTTITAAKAGTAVLQAKLVKVSDSSVVDVEEVTFTVAENSSTTYTYEINDISTLYQNANADDGDDAISNGELVAQVNLGYAKEVAVTAKDASGNAFELPADAIVNMTIDGAGKEIEVQKETTSGKWYVVTSDNAETEDWTATLSVVINADDTVKTLTKEVTVSKDAPVAQSIMIKDKNYDDSAVADAKDVEEYTVANAAGYVSSDQSGAQDVYVWVEDQFGGYGLSASADLNLAAVSGMNGISEDTVAISSGAVDVADGSADTTFTADDAQFRIIATSGAQTDFITVTVTDGVLPVASIPSATDATTNDVDTLVITLSEAISDATTGTAISDGADVTSYIDDTNINASGGGSVGAITSATYDLDTLTITVVIANAEDSDNFDLDLTSLEDAAENEGAADITYTYDGTDGLWK